MQFYAKGSKENAYFKREVLLLFERPFIYNIVLNKYSSKMNKTNKTKKIKWIKQKISQTKTTLYFIPLYSVLISVLAES